MPLLDLADCALLYDGCGRAVGGVGVNLDAHLCDDVGLVRGEGQLAGLIDGVGQGLLAIDVQAEADGGECYWGVHVVGGADVDRVDFVCFFFEQLSPVAVLAGVGELLGGLCEIVGIDVADGNDIGCAAVKD